MGWKAMLTVARNATLSDIAGAGLEPDGTTVSAQQAAAYGLGQSLSAVAVGDDVLVIGHGTDQDLSGTLAETLGTEVVSARFMSTVEYYTWTVHHDRGKREWAFGEGRQVADEGDPLPEETGIARLDERTLFALLRARTGITADDWIHQTAVSMREARPGRSTRTRRGPFRRQG